MPQRNIEGQYSDSRPYYKLSLDKQNDNMGWRNPSSDNLEYKSDETMNKGQEDEKEDNSNDSNEFESLKSKKARFNKILDNKGSNI